LALLFSSLLSMQENTVWAFAVATIIYSFSLMRVKVEWVLRVFLYAAFTCFWITVRLYMSVIELQQHVHYAFLITSVLIAILWFINKGLWVRRMAYYLVPFSIFGIITISFVDPQDLSLFLVTLLYTVG